jgi:hypothetical protein
VSRETRLLLTAGVLAIVALWLLARVRFQDRPVTPNPVPAVLGQLANRPTYEDLAAEIAQLQVRVEPSLLVLDVPSAVPGSPSASHRLWALRLRDDLAVTLLPAGSHPELWNDSRVLARDPASGLVVVRVPSQVPASPLVPWTPRRLEQPRYLVASDVSSPRVSLRPVFVGSLDPMESPLWSEPIWAVPGRSDLAPGSFVFTNSAELVGLVFAHDAEAVVMPAATVLAEADRLLNTPRGPVGTLGLQVQALTASVASVTGAPVGMVVTWVEQDGAAAGHLMVGDAIEAIDGRALATPQHWDVRLARLLAGEMLTLRVRRRGEVQEVALTAAPVESPPVSRALGLTLRGRTGIGTVVARVERASAADRAGLAAGDIITRVADVHAPTPAQVTRAFASVREGQRVMVAVTRGDMHLVTTLER